MRIRSYAASDVGRRREKNEDSYLANDELGLYAVADGMGGHFGGDYASRIAATTVEEVIAALESDPEMTLQEGENIRPGEYQAYLRYALKLSSKRIYERATTDPALRGMGTTAVILFFRRNKVYVANVGDSRAYRVRNDRIIQVTKDHSLVGEQIRAGVMSEDEARGSRFRNIITRSVGFQEDVEADIDIKVARAGDRFLLCSDGLTNMLKDREILEIVVTNELEHACRRLIDIANERGGDDNITVILTEVERLDEEPPARPLPDDQTIDM
jgi:PPM family protein phosphatase